jgi:hypothetical protein
MYICNQISIRAFNWGMMTLAHDFALAAQHDWADDNHLTVDGVKFFVTTADFAMRSTTDQLVYLKTRSAIEQELALLEGKPVRNILEFGVWQGGSVAFLDLTLKPERLVALDLNPAPIEPLNAYISQRGRSAHVKPCYGVNQADAARVASILDQEFPDGIDLIIDDASHLYEETRSSFCTSFPRLNPGGLYIVEDWGWAHWPEKPLWDTEYFKDKAAVTDLLVEVSIACAASPETIEEVRVYPWMFAIRRGKADLTYKPLDLSSLALSRGKPINTGLLRPQRGTVRL